VRIFLIDEIGESMIEGKAETPLRLAPALGLPQLPQGYTVSAEAGRKFIVVEGFPDAAETPELVVLIGPVMTAYDSYYHKDLFREVKAAWRAEIRGGGRIKTWMSREGWHATFHDNSGDFGVFSPRILEREHMKRISRALNMPCQFEWREHVGNR